jgi:hypothetical protein
MPTGEDRLQKLERLLAKCVALQAEIERFRREVERGKRNPPERRKEQGEG